MKRYGTLRCAAFANVLCHAVLSRRAIAQANITREYLHTLVQNDYKMPSGPVIISPHGLLPSLYRSGSCCSCHACVYVSLLWQSPLNNRHTHTQGLSVGTAGCELLVAAARKAPPVRLVRGCWALPPAAAGA